MPGGRMMADGRDPQQWADRHEALSESMPGFTGLILAMQGLLVGVSLATSEVWFTPDAATTLELAWSKRNDIHMMTLSFGIEQ